MDIKDFRKFVNDSPIKDKLNSLKITLNYPYLGSKIELDGIQSIYKFIFDQVVGWNRLENSPDYLKNSKNHFESLKVRIIRLTDYFTEAKLSQFDAQWNQFAPLCSSSKTDNRYFVFLYDATETDFLIKLNAKDTNYISGALDYILSKNLNQVNTTDYFTGAMFAYEFKNQTESEILHRRNNERISLGQIKEKYNEYIVEAEQQLNGYLSDAKENLTNHFETVEALKLEKNKNFEDWFQKVSKDYVDWSDRAQGNFDHFFEESKKSIIKNEELYKEKLRLEAPAKYWKDRAIKLKTEGNKYLNWLIGISSIAAILLFTLLMFLGTDYFEEAFKDNIKGIKWSIILVTIVSLLAFSIKILSKMTFSAFHLSRDAEEREQLTHFYLSLKKDTTIEPEERQLILQSLFSRADTGLLKEDSSPTMPSGLIDKYVVK